MQGGSDNSIVFEVRARYAPGEGWITLDVCASKTVTLDEGLFRRDPWGRTPTELRLVPVHIRRRSP
jgi:hypothetical protein